MKNIFQIIIDIRKKFSHTFLRNLHIHISDTFNLIYNYCWAHSKSSKESNISECILLATVKLQENKKRIAWSRNRTAYLLDDAKTADSAGC